MMSVIDKKPSVPELRFPEFNKLSNGEIRERLFADLFLFSSGKNIKQGEASPDFDTLCVRYGELYHLYGEVITKIINKTNISHDELRFSEGDEILLPSAGEDPLDIGAASALILKNVAIGRTINVLKPINENEYNTIFVSYYINSVLKKKISRLARGSSISNVYNSDLKTLKINLPKLPEQQKIAEFLGAVDEKIAQLGRKKALLEDYKKGCMQKLFSRELRFKDDNGNDFPDWEEKRLEEVAERVKSRNIDNEKNILTISAQDGLVSQLDYFKNLVASKDLSAYYVLENGYFAYNKSYSRGFPMGAIKKLKKYKRGIVSPLYICFKVNRYLLVQFCEWYFNSQYQNKYLSKITQEGARNHGLLNMSIVDFFKMPLPCPHPDEQHKIADFLSTIDSKIDCVAQELAHAQTFKKGLLQKMFV